jgi:hypothetical protein
MLEAYAVETAALLKADRNAPSGGVAVATDLARSRTIRSGASGRLRLPQMSGLMQLRANRAAGMAIQFLPSNVLRRHDFPPAAGTTRSSPRHLADGGLEIVSRMPLRR